jgi:ZIP family zinc transporter
MLEAALWGLLTAGSLWVGAALAAFGHLSERMIGLAMAFGAGALIAAVAYELVVDAFETDLTLASVGFACGGLTFYVGDTVIDRMGGEGRKSMTGTSQLAGSASAIVLGTVLDGIPESFVLGASLLQEGVYPSPSSSGCSSPTCPRRSPGRQGSWRPGGRACGCSGCGAG